MSAAVRPPQSWEEALERLEAHVERAERIIRGEITPDAPAADAWVEPVGLGPVPVEFVLRAQQLLARQQRLIRTLPQILADMGRQKRITARVSDATAVPAAPVYLDVTA